MVESKLIPILNVSISIFILFGWYNLFYKKTRVDRYREDLFTIRDRLFDFMWKNGLSYNLSAYKLLRDYLNGGIRVCDLFTPVTSIPFLFFFCRNTKRGSGQSDLAKTTSDIEDPIVKDHFDSVIGQITYRNWQFFFLEGPQWVIFKPLDRGVKNLLLNKKQTTLNELRFNIDHRLQVIENDFIILGKNKSATAQIITSRLLAKA